MTDLYDADDHTLITAAPTGTLTDVQLAASRLLHAAAFLPGVTMTVLVPTPPRLSLRLFARNCDVTLVTHDAPPFGEAFHDLSGLPPAFTRHRREEE